MNYRVLIICVFSLLYNIAAAQQQKETDTSYITPGAIWPDNDGNHIQAHGGGIIKIGNIWYWLGEYRGKDVLPDYRYVGCYASTDLIHWTFLNKISFSAPKGMDSSSWILERPKVFYNKKSQQYVMYFHLDDKHYSAAEVGIAVSKRIDSGYTIINHFRPFGMESRDIGQFIDDDGTAYLIFESRPVHGFVIARLSDDYTNLEQKICLIQAPLEGGAIVHYKGLYYVIGSHLTGWSPNPNVYAVSKSLKGPWSDFKNMAPVDKNTYGAQSSNIVKVAGAKDITAIFVGDIWNPSEQWNSRYLWMPLIVKNDSMLLPEPRPWTINVKTGISKMK